MKRIIISIAAFLFLAWVSAIFLNIDIYRKTNIELNIFGPIIDAILIVAIFLIGFSFVALNWQNKTMQKMINTGLLIMGICTIFFISYFYVITFR